MKLTRYETYKDSGVEWLGEVPEHWEVKKLKLFSTIKSGEAIRNEDLYDKGNYEVYGGNGFIGFSNRYNVDNEKIIIGRVGAYCGNVRYINAKKWISDNALILSLNSSENYNFFISLLESANLNNLNTSNAQPLITGNKVMNFKLPIPSKHEQTKIANFLDQKTAQIDKAISLKEKLIEKLKEYRQILINDAVTKGLDKNVKMKDSGVEWIGEVPEHWEIVRSKRLFMARKEKARQDDLQLTASQKHGVIYQKDFMQLENRKVTQVEFNPQILKRAEPNDFLISMRSFQGGIEYCKYAGSISSAYIALIPIKHVVPEYFKYLFKSYSYIKALSSTSNLVRDGQALRFDNFSLVDLLIIPDEEQKEIAIYLDKQTKKIDKVINQQQKQIEKLKEYKASLIDSVVTGKVRVL